NGHLVVRNAVDGAVLKDIEVGTGIIAAPMADELNGDQYVAVMAGYGGGGSIQIPAQPLIKIRTTRAFSLSNSPVARRRSPRPARNPRPLPRPPSKPRPKAWLADRGSSVNSAATATALIKGISPLTLI